MSVNVLQLRTIDEVDLECICKGNVQQSILIFKCGFEYDRLTSVKPPGLHREGVDVLEIDD